jgi:hypothetical protein
MSGLAAEVPVRVRLPAMRLDTVGAWLLGVMWVLPLLWAVWSSIHPASAAASFDLFGRVTLRNFAAAWGMAPFDRYMANTVLLVSMVVAAQFVLCTPAAFAFARLNFPGRNLVFGLVLIQLMITPDVLMVENYQNSRVELDLSELLRIKSQILAAQHDRASAMNCLTEALAVARAQSALAWELRSTMVLTRLLSEGGQRDQARHTLALVYDRFTEGFETADLKLARALLEDLGQPF